MYKYECEFSVDGRRTKTIVCANDSYSARKLIESQYPASKIIWYGSKSLGRA